MPARQETSKTGRFGDLENSPAWYLAVDAFAAGILLFAIPAYIFSLYEAARVFAHWIGVE